MLRGLAGTRVLIVEDEPLSARGERAAFEEAGAVIVGAVDNEAAAFAILLQKGVDLVLLDWNLQGLHPAKLVAYLQAVPVPFVIVTGYDRDYLPMNLRTAPYVQKPYARTTLLMLIEALLRSG